MTKLTDWKNCYKLWAEYMYFEAAERGYDFDAASKARDAYYKACTAYQEVHGKAFDPYTTEAA